MKTRRMNKNILEICDENDRVIISIKEHLDGNNLVIEVAGEITNEVAHEFEDEVMAALSVCHNLIINLEKVTYIASATLKSLLSVQQIIDEIEESSMILTRVSPEVMSVFEETGFSDILQIAED